jgi:photosystem II stability/assembly factor-like uncharacterized protein
MKRALRSLCAALAVTTVLLPLAAGEMSAGGGNARPSRLAASNLLLAGTRAGSRLVVVGEYGHVLLSDDDGANWRQATFVPTRTTLTAVFFVNARTGWAVGHGGIVIGTSDGGDNWRLLSGHIAGRDALFSVWFRDENHGLVVGSYGYAARSDDGGVTWHAFKIADGELAERHLNYIFAGEGTLFIAAESGTVFRSVDGGASFEAIALPYRGSMWGGTGLSDRTLLLWGMGGTVLRSSDEGRSWASVVTGTDQAVAGGAQLADGTIVLAGLNGVVLESHDRGQSFRSSVRPDRATAAAVLATRRGYLLLGPSGIRSH